LNISWLQVAAVVVAVMPLITEVALERVDLEPALDSL
jgi:hypothetical protein